MGRGCTYGGRLRRRLLARAIGIPGPESDPGKAAAGLLLYLDNATDDPGRVLIGLTTKTAQELAMSSEAQRLNFTLSMLYSLLYAPLLYFHDLEGESEHDEMLPLDPFDVNYEARLFDRDPPALRIACHPSGRRGGSQYGREEPRKGV